jgi:hypothetical protein
VKIARIYMTLLEQFFIHHPLSNLTTKLLPIIREADTNYYNYILKSSIGRDNNYCYYVSLPIAGFAITLNYHPAG